MVSGLYIKPRIYPYCYVLQNVLQESNTNTANRFYIFMLKTKE